MSSNDLLAEELLAMQIASRSVFRHREFILGPEVGTLEAEFVRLFQCKHAVVCNSGFGAHLLTLLSLSVGAGARAAIPAFGPYSLAGTIRRRLGTPVFLDLSEDGQMVTGFRKKLESVDIVVVHDLFYGQNNVGILRATAPSRPIVRVATESFASLLASPRIDQTTATIACLRDERTLGAPGEIGMVLTDDSELANRLRYIRAEFNPSDEHEGIESANFHPDTLLAAFLIEMLEKRLEAIRRRDHRIRELLFDLNQLGLRAIQVPIPDGNTACSRLVVFARKRDDLVHRLRGASSMRAKKWWPIPLHLQKGFRDLKYQQGDFPNCEALAAQNIELPLPSTYEERARLFAVLTEHSLVCEATPQEQYAL